MRMGSLSLPVVSLAAGAALVVAATCVSAQGRGGGGNGPLDRMVVDAAAADRGRAIYAAQCVTCHGGTARGGEGGPNILRSEVVIRNRGTDTLAPFLKKGHTMQGGASSATLSDAQILDVAHFLRQRFNDTFRGSPVFVPGDILVGNATAGAAFFNGAGRCATCHAPGGNLAGIGAKYDPVNLQQRMIFPMVGGGRGGAAAAATVKVTLPSGQTLSGDLVHLDDFTVTLRDAARAQRTVARAPGVKVEKTDRFAYHIALLDTITDTQMHDLVAYLETMK